MLDTDTLRRCVIAEAIRLPTASGRPFSAAMHALVSRRITYQSRKNHAPALEAVHAHPGILDLHAGALFRLAKHRHRTSLAPATRPGRRDECGLPCLRNEILSAALQPDCVRF